MKEKMFSALFLWMLISCICALTVVADCEQKGWFGSKCQYMCHCNNGNCNADGKCASPDTCQRGWFGPSCQYSDLAASGKAVKFPGTENASELIDGDDNTCISRPREVQSVKLMLSRDYLFTWLRISMNESQMMDKIQIQFTTISGDVVDCRNGKVFRVSDYVMDVYCDINTTVKEVIINGSGVKALCSVYISGGRNVALKNENTSQSSTFHYKHSSKAVDGDTNQDYESGSCSHTGTHQSSAWWQLTFSQPQLINRFVIYNRKDALPERLQGFILTVIYATENFRYQDKEVTPLEVYTVVLAAIQGTPVSKVDIEAKYSTQEVSYILTLCEVEIYGDSACNQGMYGPECDKPCKCEASECFDSTGACPSGCVAGYHGAKCDQKCKPPSFGPDCKETCTNCWNSSCDIYNGMCYRCPPGKVGDYCDRDCPHLKFGENCSQNCNTNCGGNGSCDPVNGSCTQGCDTGFTGLHCEQTCDYGKYGAGCGHNCSQNCAQEGETFCHHVSGKCLAPCHSGYSGEMCDVECDYGKYGAGCGHNCSQNCTQEDEKFCHHVSGKCLAPCRSGYSGEMCDVVLPQEIAPTVSKLVAPIAGGVAAFIAVLIIIAITGVAFWRKSRNKKPLTQEALYNEENMMDSNHGHSNVFLEPAVCEPTKVTKPAVPPKPQVSGVSEVTKAENINTVLTTMIPSTLIVLKDFETFMSSHNSKFFQEQFLTIPANNDATVTVGLSDENKSKNRYKNICAYDHSRVHLLASKSKGHGDYINASYVEGFKNEEMFIASQGPTKTMLEDFVRMLWEQKVEKVVMLTNLIENGKEKCERYWPEVDEIKVGEISVKLATTQVFADCTIRRLQLSKKGEEVQSLKHFHFTSWPDKDVPTAPWGLVDFEQRVAADKTDKPVVVHCSAGVGRTGTFIALRNIMRQAEDTGHLDFFMTVKQLRRDRINMVQTARQYEFLHRAAQVAMLCTGTTVTSRDISYRIKTLSMMSESGHTNIENEFKAICNVCNVDVTERNEAQSEEPIYHVYENSYRMSNKYKNRLSNILPKEFYRVVLQCEDDGMEDYINAVFVPSFSKQNQQILTQLPLPSTVTDLWRLVTQNRVSLIVAFEVDTKETDKTVRDYLPSGENSAGSFAHFDVTTEPPITTELWEQQKLTVTADTSRIAKQSSFREQINGELHVTHLKCAVNFEPENLLALVKHIRSLSPAGEGRILYMCRNGADYCGLLCILSLLLDRLDNDQCLTVPLVVGAIKAIRPQVVPTLDQYKLLYQVLNMYNESLNVYSNFGE